MKIQRTTGLTPFYIVTGLLLGGFCLCPAYGQASFQGLGDLPGGQFRSTALSVSADGSVVVGRSSSSAVSGFYEDEAFRWTRDGGMVGLGDFAGGNFDSEAWDVSADGSVVVGFGSIESNNFGFEAFRWTSESGMVGLGDLEGPSIYSRAFDVSSDGSVVVGEARSQSGFEAFIWDEINGMQSLKQVLETQYGLNLTGWTLNRAWAISANGLTIVGWGINPDSNVEAWIATLPAPPDCPADLNDDGIVNVTDLLVLLASWGVCPATGCRADLNGDGFVNVTDLLELLTSRGACAGSECRADLNGDGFVNALDLMELLASRGPCPDGECPADLNDDGFVNALDALDLLTAWGPCP